MAASSVGSLLGVVALALSVSGLYSVLTYALNQRRKEIGIRMALGATSGAVVGLVLRQSVRLAGLGIAIGAAVTFGMMQALSAVIHLRTITLVDTGAFATGVLVVGAATLFAAYHPARNATRIDPSRTLHSD
jgi:ABC-type antimicrobial peptide transport system permease subunit